MSRRAFMTTLAAIVLLGAAAMVFLYMTLGRLQAGLAGREGGSGATAAGPGSGDGSSEDGFRHMTLTPAGRAQMEQLNRDRTRSAGVGRTSAPGTASAVTLPSGATGPLGPSGARVTMVPAGAPTNPPDTPGATGTATPAGAQTAADPGAPKGKVSKGTATADATQPSSATPSKPR